MHCDEDIKISLVEKNICGFISNSTECEKKFSLAMNSKRVSIKKYRLRQNIDDFKMEFFTEIKKYIFEVF